MEAGESVVPLARWLGHSGPGFTLRTYSHFLPRAGARGAVAIDAVFAWIGLGRTESGLGLGERRLVSAGE
ncbi:hypothetical protein [Streptomyces sp. NPDC007100]|uniref:hypothetical protein n=1 Tax=Streptomyces sp. NPDC007100 TaxID=3155602 RepID=UPI0033D4955D